MKVLMVFAGQETEHPHIDEGADGWLLWREIARQTGFSRNTVRRYLQADTFPEQGLCRKRRSLLDPHLPYPRERWGAGSQNAAQLYRELRERGYHSSPTTVRALLSDWGASEPASARRTRGRKHTSPVPAQRHLSSRQASFLFVQPSESLAPSQQSYLEQICQAGDEMKQVYELSQHFISMVRQRQGEQLDIWLALAKGHGPHELRDSLQASDAITRPCEPTYRGWKVTGRSRGRSPA